MIEIGRRISHYEVLDRLGEGGMGVVYKARDVNLDRVVALKFLPSYLSAHDEAKQRFIREAKAASALDHANICTIHEIAETDEGELYIVMAHYTGSPLDELIEAGPLSVDQSVDIAVQLARALQRAHEAGITHRDLKPANVFVTDRGDVKLLDFGLAKLASGTQLTQTGTAMGTVTHMSPEQVDAKPVDHRTDLWSFGVILYEMLTGASPFEGDTAPALMFSILSKSPESVVTRRPETPANLAQCIKQCLQRDPDKRPSDARAVRELIEPAVTPEAPAVPTGRALRKPPVAAAVGAGVVILSMVGVFLLRGAGDSSGGALELSPNVVAVTPFTYRGGPDLAYLGEGIVDLMSAKLDGIGALRAVNPPRTMSYLARNDVDYSDVNQTKRMMEALEAGRYITGDVFVAGDRIQLTAYLHDTSEPTTVVVQASREGSPEDVFTLVDGIAAELLAATIDEDGDRLQALAAVTSSSVAATREYLKGEQLIRTGQNREAADAYDRAVAIDSTFALAHYKKSVVGDWIDAADVRQSIDRAVRYGDRLPERERSIVEGLAARRYGRITEAEGLFRAHLHRYPDDIDVLLQLGELYFHDNPRRGRPASEAMVPFQRAVDLDPTNLMALVHVARVYALEDSVDALSRIAGYVTEFAPEGERVFEVDAMYAWVADDTTQQRRIRDQLRDQPWVYVWYSAHGVSRFARSPHGAAELLEGQRSGEPLLLISTINTAVDRGQVREVRALMQNLYDAGNATLDLVNAFSVTSGAFATTPSDFTFAYQRVAALEAADIQSTALIPPYFDLTDRFAGYERDYQAGLLLIQMGHLAEAEQVIARLDAQEPFPGLGSVGEDAVASLRAEVFLQQRDSSAALEVLRTLQFEVPHAATVRAVADNARARYLLAELEFAIGDRAAARSYFEGLDKSWSPFDGYYRAFAYQRLAEIAEAEGRVDDARRYYDLLLDQWRDADPQFDEARRVLEDRRAALPDS